MRWIVYILAPSQLEQVGSSAIRVVLQERCGPLIPSVVHGGTESRLRWTYGSLRDSAAQQRLRAGQSAVEKASFQSGLGDFSDTGRTQSVGLAPVRVR